MIEELNRIYRNYHWALDKLERLNDYSEMTGGRILRMVEADILATIKLIARLRGAWSTYFAMFLHQVRR